MLSHECFCMKVGRMHRTHLDGPWDHLIWSQCALHHMSMGDKKQHHWWGRSISFHNLVRWAEKNLLRKKLSIQRWAFYCKVWNACLNDMIVPWKWMTAYTWRACFNWSRVHNWLTILMGVGTMHTINQRTILGRIQEMNDLLSFLMINQATLHLGALSNDKQREQWLSRTT